MDRYDEDDFEEQDDAGDGGDDAGGDAEDESSPPDRGAIEAEITARVRQALQAQGLDWTGDGVAIRDRDVAAQRFGAPAARTEPVKGDEDEEKFDLAYATQESFERYLDRRVEKATKAYQEQLQTTQQMLVEDRMAGALGRVEGACERHAKHVLPYLDHPDFRDRLGEALAQTPTAAWQDAKTLAKLASFIVPDLDEARMPRPQGRDQAGRFTPADRAAAQRAALGAAGPSPSRGRVPEGGEDSDERHLAALIGVDMEEWRALGDPTYQASRRLAQRRARK